MRMEKREAEKQKSRTAEEKKSEAEKLRNGKSRESEKQNGIALAPLGNSAFQQRLRRTKSDGWSVGDKSFGSVALMPLDQCSPCLCRLCHPDYRAAGHKCIYRSSLIS